MKLIIVFFEKYGTAFLLTAITAGVRIGSATITSNSKSSTTNSNSTTSQVVDEGSKELSEKIGEITASVLESTVNLKPIIRLSQGTRLQIRPQKDWYIKPIEN